MKWIKKKNTNGVIIGYISEDKRFIIHKHKYRESKTRIEYDLLDYASNKVLFRSKTLKLAKIMAENR